MTTKQITALRSLINAAQDAEASLEVDDNDTQADVKHRLSVAINDVRLAFPDLKE